MRSLVGIITTIATVIHFTFGCCLHPCHVGGRGECVAHAIEPAGCAAFCHDHGQEDAAHEPAGLQCGHGEGGLMAAVDTEDCHGCEGCRCAATVTETLTMFPWSPLASGIVAAIDAEAIALFAAACGRHPPDPSVQPCPGRQALFERFLI